MKKYKNRNVYTALQIESIWIKKKFKVNAYSLLYNKKTMAAPTTNILNRIKLNPMESVSQVPLKYCDVNHKGIV